MASPVDTSVTFFHSAMLGAPNGLRGAAGLALPIFQACLVDGFGEVTLTSLVVASGIATATLPGAHAAMVDSVVLISGVSDMTGLNGRQKATARFGNTVSFATALADGTASGTVLLRMAPAGWTRDFTATNVSVFRPPAVDSIRPYLKITDTATLDLRVIGYEAMTSVTVGTGLFPTTAQLSGGVFWGKAESTAAGVNPWMLFADGKCLYFCVNTGYNADNARTAFAVYGFGDFKPFKPSADPYAVFLSGAQALTSAWTATLGVQVMTGAMFTPRAHSGSGTAQPMDWISSVGATLPSGRSTRFGDYPGLADALYLASSLVSVTGSATGPRGRLAGLWDVPQNVAPGTFSAGDVTSGGGETAGRRLMVVPVGEGIDAIAGPLLFDVTGPW